MRIISIERLEILRLRLQNLALHVQRRERQLQMRTVKPADLAMAIKWAQPTIASRPPASNGMGRHLGGPEWHGDSMYKRFWPSASKAFQPLDQMRRPYDIPGWPEERMKKFVI